MGKNRGLFKKLHKWPGLIISFILLYFAITGMFMNHRGLISGLDVPRNILPKNYKYQNWNNSALKGSLIISPDSILIYGNIGIWLTDSDYRNFKSFNSGFPRGSDNRKIFDVHQAGDNELYAATLYGMYAYNRELRKWDKFRTDVDIERFTGIISIGDTIYAINRSHLFKGKSEGVKTVFTKIELPAPEGYVNKVSLFETIWQIHSGEIFGLPGKLFVDILGIITAFLSVTGIIYFFSPGWIKRSFKRNKPSLKIARINKWSLKWHNKVGAWVFVLLIVLFLTGIFLRPPLLIAIAKAEIAPFKYSHLDQPNPWYDKLRDVLYDEDRGIILLSTSDGMFFMDVDVLHPVMFQNQPPVSVMGINVFEHYKEGAFLIGSFSGLFLWDPGHPEIYNYPGGTLYQGNPAGRPVGELIITGTISNYKGNQYLVDYDRGVLPLWDNDIFPKMPENILKESKMSLWNVCLEIHTGRFFQGIFGDFYIFIVPLCGITGITVVISGYLLWRRKYRKRNKNISRKIARVLVFKAQEPDKAKKIL